MSETTIDPRDVHAGDQVTVRFIATGDVIATTAYRPEDVTQPGWVYLLGWPLNKPGNLHGLAVKHFEILDHLPAPKPLPTKDGSIVRYGQTEEYQAREYHRIGGKWHEVNGANVFADSDFTPGWTSVRDVVTDRPLPTREQVLEVVEETWHNDRGFHGTTDAVMALLRGESR